jgi:hypothetical protein
MMMDNLRFEPGQYAEGGERGGRGSILLPTCIFLSRGGFGRG